MRLYHEINAFRKWRDVAREKMVGRAAALVQRYLKKVIVCWKINENAKSPPPKTNSPDSSKIRSHMLSAIDR